MFKKTSKTMTLGVIKPEEVKKREAETKPENSPKPEQEKQNK